MNRKGITLIELLVALCVSGVLLGGVYKTFTSQQHTYTVQDQIVDMQQNVRVAINRMTRELRMAGFGGGGVDGWSSTEFFNHGAMYGAYSNVVNPAGGGTSVTVVEGFQPLIATTLSVNASTGSKSIFVNDASSFDTANMQYISIDGSEAHCISAINAGTKELQFNGWDKLTNDHLAGEPVYLLQAITYSIGPSEGKSCLLRDDHLGAGPQPVAENVETLQFAYFDVNGNPTANPPDIRMIQLNVVARTDMSDPDIAKTGDGFRRRTLTSNIQLRNLLF